MHDRCTGRLCGRLSLAVRDARGTRTLDGPNLILGAATAVAHRALAGDTGAAFARVAVGTSSAPPTPDDLGPIGDAVEVLIQSVSHPTPGETQIVFRVEEGQANALGSIAEFVLLTSDGTAFARTLRGPILKNDQVQIEGTWTISGTLSDGGV